MEVKDVVEVLRLAKVGAQVVTEARDADPALPNEANALYHIEAVELWLTEIGALPPR